MTLATPLSISPLRATVGPARAADVPAIAHLLAHWAAAGETLPRTPEDIRAARADFVVARSGESVVGCGAIHPYHATLAELRSVGVAPAVHGGGIGRRIVQALLDECAQRQIERVFVLTRAPQFFGRLGFTTIPIETLPEKVFRDCAACPKQSCCDEIAMEYTKGATS